MIITRERKVTQLVNINKVTNDLYKTTGPTTNTTADNTRQIQWLTIQDK